MQLKTICSIVSFFVMACVVFAGHTISLINSSQSYPVPISGHWMVTTNTISNEVVVALNSAGSISYDDGITWSNIPMPSTYNVKICGSLDGRCIYSNSGMSTNYGVTWVSGPGGGYYDTCCSYDGSVVVAAINGSLQVSIDYGVTWSNAYPDGSSAYFACACSSNGNIIYTCDGGGAYKSTDRGQTWGTAGFNNYNGLACSANGTIVYGMDGSGNIQKSSNGGSSWGGTGGSVSFGQYVACSTNGQYVIASTLQALRGGQQTWSTNGGSTWTTMTLTPDGQNGTTAVSPQGKIFLVGDISDGLVISRDSGKTWTTNSDPGSSVYCPAYFDTYVIIVTTNWVVP